MDKWQVLQSFWESFGLSAYDETLVDSDTGKMPYITYSASVSGFDAPIALTASLWYYSMSWAAISQKADEIQNAIGEGGVNLPCTGGTVWIKQGEPFSERMSDPDARIRRMGLNIMVEFM